MTEFSVAGSVVQIHPGPVVTTYEFKPDAGIKYSKIVGLADVFLLPSELESFGLSALEATSTSAWGRPLTVRATLTFLEEGSRNFFPIPRIAAGGAAWSR